MVRTRLPGKIVDDFVDNLVRWRPDGGARAVAEGCGDDERRARPAARAGPAARGDPGRRRRRAAGAGPPRRRGGDMRTVVAPDIQRADPARVAELAAFGVATVHEAVGRTGYLGPALRPIQQDTRVGGTAVTALCWPGDN